METPPNLPADWNPGQPEFLAMIIQKFHEMQERLLVNEEKLRTAEARVAELEKENRDLRARLGLDSTNSHRPPSSDGETGRNRRRAVGNPKKGDRKAGAQKGHPGHRREMLPPEQVDRIVHVQPQGTCECGICLDEAQKEVYRTHQVAELVGSRGLTLLVTNYVLYKGACQCGKEFRTHPPHEAAFCAGPMMMAFVVVMMGKFHLSREQVQELLEMLFGIALSKGTIQAIAERASEALVKPVAELEAALPKTPSVNVDETGWRVKGIMNWLWIAVSQAFVVFTVQPRRGNGILRQWFGKNYQGTVQSDRWTAYLFFATYLRQLCWSHLMRDIRAVEDAGGSGKEEAHRILSEANNMFSEWHRFKAGEITREQLQSRTQPFRTSFRSFCEAGVKQDQDPKWATFGKGMLRLWEAIFRFLDVDGLEPTNNLAEQLLRAAVIWRRLCHGTRSSKGSLFAARILSVVQTCRRQERNTLRFVHESILAWMTGLPPPSLMPA